MAAKLLALLASLSLWSATCLSSEIRRIYNPPHQAVYAPRYAPPAGPDGPRLILIGDVHGMRTELDALLAAAAEFSPARGDRVIFAGDTVNKGPDSASVVQLAMDINATTVRGNHEDRVLRAWAGAEIARALAEANGRDPAAAVAAYEATLSLSYAHAGMAPGVAVENQEPWAMYNVRSVLYPDEQGGFATQKEADRFHVSVRTKLRDGTPGGTCRGESSA